MLVSHKDAAAVQAVALEAAAEAGEAAAEAGEAAAVAREAAGEAHALQWHRPRAAAVAAARVPAHPVWRPRARAEVARMSVNHRADPASADRCRDHRAIARAAV